MSIRDNCATWGLSWEKRGARRACWNAGVSPVMADGPLACRTAETAVCPDSRGRLSSTSLRRRRLIFASSRKKNCHGKGDDGSKANTPREFHHGQPTWLCIQLSAKNTRNVVRQSAKDCHDDEPNDHCNHIAEIVAAAFCQHPDKENA